MSLQLIYGKAVMTCLRLDKSKTTTRQDNYLKIYRQYFERHEINIVERTQQLTFIEINTDLKRF